MLLGQASGHWSLKDHPFTNYGTAIGTNDHLDLSTRDTGDFACDDVRKNRLTKAVEEFFQGKRISALVAEVAFGSHGFPLAAGNGTH